MSVHQTLRAVAAQLRIAHHVPGRVRLKLDGDAGGLPVGAAAVGEFVRAAQKVPGIAAVNVNLLARSCVVEYDRRVILPEAWQDLVDGTPSPSAEALLDALAAARG